MNSHQLSSLRSSLLNIVSASLTSVSGRHVVFNYLSTHPLPQTPVRVVAIGKAAASMMQGALDAIAERIESGLVITKTGHTEDFASVSVAITQIESAHPYADERSLLAGEQLLQFIRTAPSPCGFLFLISGGASSLVEVLPPGIDLSQLQRFNTWLLAQGWTIDVMNQLRKSISCIKGGRLARLLGGHDVLQFLISDVPGDALAVIGSGLLAANTQTSALPADLPDWLQTMQARNTAAPAMNSTVFENIQSLIIATNSDLRMAVVRLAQKQGYSVQCNAFIEGDAARQGQAIAQQLLAGPVGLYVWGGETVVPLPEQPGQGGRCQHLALAAAEKLAGQQQIALVVLGTDGSDGPGDIAGALVDGETVQRGDEGGANTVADSLNRADAGSFLAASGDLIDTGPTGTNVMDLIVGLKT